MMTKRKASYTPLLLIGLWAACLIGLLVLRPKVHSPLFWLLIIPALAFGGAQMYLSSREAQRTKTEYAAWMRQLGEAADDTQLGDFQYPLDELFWMFEPEERQQIVDELLRMPKGSRRLRRALDIVDPEIEKV
jgi:hypothetical protein